MVLPFLPLVAEFMAKGIERSHGELTERGVCQQLINREASLWLVSEDHDPLAIIVTKYETWSGEKVCRIILLAGKRIKDWQHLEEVFHVKLKQDGITRVIEQGRPGWLRAKMSRGYRPIAIVMERAL